MSESTATDPVQWSREDVQFCLDDLLAMRHLDYTLVDGTASTIMGLVEEIEALREIVRLTVAGVYPNAIEDADYVNHVVPDRVVEAAQRVVPIAHYVTSRHGPCRDDCPGRPPHRNGSTPPVAP